MAEISEVHQLIDKSTKLSLNLYEFAQRFQTSSKDVNAVATVITLFSVTLKQVATGLAVDDKIPSSEAVETLQEILHQCRSVFTEIENLIPLRRLEDRSDSSADHHDESGPWKLDLVSEARLHYLLAHLDSLQMTLTVMMQLFGIVKSMQPDATALQHLADRSGIEKMHLEALVIEQQMSLLRVSELFESYERSRRFSSSSKQGYNNRDGSISSYQTSTPDMLRNYRHQSLVKIDTPPSGTKRLSKVRGIVGAHTDDLMYRWTTLRQIEDVHHKSDFEKESLEQDTNWQRRQNQQAFVESDDSGDDGRSDVSPRSRQARIESPLPKRPITLNRAFSEATTLPIPIPTSRKSNAYPDTPTSLNGSMVSPTLSHGFPPSPAHSYQSNGYSPKYPGPGASSGHLPVRAAVAATNKAEDESSGLEIPWRVCAHGHFWEYVDNEIKKTNTDDPPSTASTDRHAWTEILASWVSHKALDEGRYKYQEVQKPVEEGRRTKFQPCFYIAHPLKFKEVERLVERTIELLSEPSKSKSKDSPTDGKEGHRKMKTLPDPRLSQHPPPLDRSYSSPAASLQTPKLSPNQQSFHLPHLQTSQLPGMKSTTNLHNGVTPSPLSSYSAGPYLDPSSATRSRADLPHHQHRNIPTSALKNSETRPGSSHGASHGKHARFSSPSPSASSKDSDSEDYGKRERRKERDRERDRSERRDRDRDRDRDHGRDRERERDRDRDRDGHKDKSKGGHISGRKAMSSAAKIGGVLALLEGLENAL